MKFNQSILPCRRRKLDMSVVKNSRRAQQFRRPIEEEINELFTTELDELPFEIRRAIQEVSR